MPDNMQTLIPALAAFLVTVALSRMFIPLLRRLKAGQTVREDGPQDHLKKSGTPTMGGMFFLGGLVLAAVFYIPRYPAIAPILGATLGFGIIGFLDDYLKVVKKRSLGLRAWAKIAGQLIVTALFAYYITVVMETPLGMKVPFSHYELDFGAFNYVILFFIFVATVNGANLTDGLDGLLASVTLPISLLFAAVSIGLGSGAEPAAMAMAGALAGFLLFNAHPASVFMGDTGSLALGGFVAATAYMTGLQLFIPLFAFIYVVEAASVIIQVGYFKYSGGKRVFKMAPFHHHLELSGHKETKVVAAFFVITSMLCLVALMGLDV